MINTKTSKSFTFTGYIEKRSYSPNYSYNRILLRNVRLGKLLFRDHVWIKESKFLKTVENGYVIKFSANVTDYINPDNLQIPKKGVCKLRNVEKMKKMKIQKFLKMNNYYEEKI